MIVRVEDRHQIYSHGSGCVRATTTVRSTYNSSGQVIQEVNLGRKYIVCAASVQEAELLWAEINKNEARLQQVMGRMP